MLRVAKKMLGITLAIMLSNFFAPAFLSTIEKAPVQGIEFRRCHNLGIPIELIKEVNEKESKASSSNDHVPPLLDLASHFFNLTLRNKINAPVNCHREEGQPRIFTLHHVFLI
jgi:hypothetical protein